MNPIVWITIIVILIIELWLLFRIIHSFSAINNNIIGKDKFKSLLELYENKRAEKIDEKFHWIKNLCWSSGRNASVWDLKTVIRSVYESDLLRIKINSNLGPALGILATFIGLGFTLYELYHSGQSLMMKSEIGGLFPVMIGGAAGIAVYALGNRFYRKAQSVISRHEKIYLEVFFEFDEGVRLRLSKARSMEEIYEGFLEHVTKLAGKFTDISNRYDDLNNSLRTTITSLNTTMENNLEKMNNSINTNLDQYIVNLGKTNDKLLVESQTKIDNYIEKIDNSSSRFNKNMQTNLTDLNKNFEKYLAGIERNLGKYIGDFQKNKEELLKKSQENIEKYLDKINKIYDSINKITAKSSENLSGLSKETKQMLGSLTGINKDFIRQYRQETSKQLEFITRQANQANSEVGTLLKTIESTYSKNLKATAQLLDEVDKYQKNLKKSSESTETLSKSLKQVSGLVDKLHNSVVSYLDNIEVIKKVTEKIDDQNNRINELVNTTNDRVMNIDQFVHEIKEVKDFLQHADKKAISPLTDLALEIRKLPGDWIIKLTKELKEIKQCIKSPHTNFPAKNPLDNKLDDNTWTSSYASQPKSPFKMEEKKEYPGEDISPGISDKVNQGQPKREKPSRITYYKHSSYKAREKSWVRKTTEWFGEKLEKIFKGNK